MVLGKMPPGKMPSGKVSPGKFPDDYIFIYFFVFLSVVE